MALAWGELSESAQHIIHIAAALTAVSVIAFYFKKVYRYVVRFKQKVAYVMSEEDAHKAIKDQLDAIAFKLEKNGGTHIPDALCRIERELAYMTARDRVAHHTNPKPIFETDDIGQIIHVNSAYKKLLGVGMENVHGMGWVNVIKGSVRESVVDSWFRAVKGKRDFDEYVELIGSDKEIIVAHVIGHAILENGELLGHLGEIIIPATEV